MLLDTHIRMISVKLTQFLPSELRGELSCLNSEESPRYCKEINSTVFRIITLLAFPNRLLLGRPEHSCSFMKRRRQAELELKLIRRQGFNPESTLTLRNMEQSLKESHVKQLVSTVAPDQNFRFSFVSGTVYLELTPKRMHSFSTSLYKPLHIMYAYGERRDLWGVKGCKQQFTPHMSPMCVVWKYCSKDGQLAKFEVRSPYL